MKSTLLGISPAFQKILREVERVAVTESTVLVSGETGTGKELVARAIHTLSPRRPGPFIPVDCAGITTELFDSEIFGHSRGAFTGAEHSRKGKILLADGGTLYLDTIDGLELSCQTRLLRAIQEREILPLGQSRARQVSFRLVSSVSDEFPRRLDEGEFRKDLYFRINVVQLRLPPLRERREDIPLLAHRFLLKASHQFEKPLRRLDRKAIMILREYHWPGNVRELHGVIECAAASSRGEILYESDLPVYVRTGALRPRAQSEPASRSPHPRRDGPESSNAPVGFIRDSKIPENKSPESDMPDGDTSAPDSPRPTFNEQVAEFQRHLLVASLGRNGWSYRGCANELGLARHQVKYLCAKLGIRRSRLG